MERTIETCDYQHKKYTLLRHKATFNAAGVSNYTIEYKNFFSKYTTKIESLYNSNFYDILVYEILIFLYVFNRFLYILYLQDVKKSVSKEKEDENFVYFWNNFKTDQKFQKAHIIFPLKYLYTEYNDASCKDDTIVSYIEKS